MICMKWSSSWTKLSRGRHKLLHIKAWESGHGEDEVALPSVLLSNGSAKGICDLVFVRTVAGGAVRVGHAIANGIQQSPTAGG